MCIHYKCVSACVCKRRILIVEQRGSNQPRISLQICTRYNITSVQAHGGNGYRRVFFFHFIFFTGVYNIKTSRTHSSCWPEGRRPAGFFFVCLSIIITIAVITFGPVSLAVYASRHTCKIPSFLFYFLF